MSFFEVLEELINTYEIKFHKELCEYPVITTYGITACEFFEKLKILVEGKSKVEDFFDPFKTELQEYLNKINNDSLRPTITEEET